MAQGLIRPGSGPNWLPTSPSPTPATCSGKCPNGDACCERGRHAPPPLPRVPPRPLLLQNRAPELPHASLSLALLLLASPAALRRATAMAVIAERQSSSYHCCYRCCCPSASPCLAPRSCRLPPPPLSLTAALPVVRGCRHGRGVPELAAVVARPP